MGVKVCKETDCNITLTEENRYFRQLLCREHGMARERERARYRQLNKRRFYMQKMWCSLKARSTKKNSQGYKSNAFGQPYLPFDEFWDWYENETKEIFEAMFEHYKDNNCDAGLAPSVDRIDSKRGYERDNIQWLTLSDNSSKGDGE